jgi:hypothetical protein
MAGEDGPSTAKAECLPEGGLRSSLCLWLLGMVASWKTAGRHCGRGLRQVAVGRKPGHGE